MLLPKVVQLSLTHRSVENQQENSNWILTAQHHLRTIKLSQANAHFNTSCIK